MVDAAPAKRFEIKKWNAVALWAWGMTLSGFKVFQIFTLTTALSAETTSWILVSHHEFYS